MSEEGEGGRARAQGAARWSLGTLLALRIHEEEVSRAELAALLVEAEKAARAMSSRTARLRETMAGAAGGGVRTGAELASAGRHAERMRRAAESAAASSALARKRAREAERAWLRARAAREALERALASWAAARRRAREAAQEADVTEAWAARRLRARAALPLPARGSSGGAG
jgi:hypothetical protein